MKAGIRNPSQTRASFRPELNICFRETTKETSMADMLKGFGCRKAYESLSCRNPRATGDGYGDFELRLMSAMA